ncbi:MAG: NAD(P)-dependent oxidoreductase [Alphaproteobacteria bacterium]|nr:NAD(P)-dependent oxidoreductase [Alphaproteobacteria bacterium]
MPDLAGYRIGVIGLGLMGRPVAEHLAAAGADLVIHNRSRAVVEALAEAGMAPADSSREVAARSDIVILMLPDTETVDDQLFGADGVAASIGAGCLVIDMGTTAVMATRDYAARIGATGAAYVDAPVSGGQVGAEAATLTIMAGGSDEDFARAAPLFAVLGRHVTHVGAIGAGQIAKAVNQVIVGLSIGAVAEAFALARAAGVDPEKVRQALAGGFAESRVLELHGKRMTEGDFTPGGRAAIQCKDMAQALDLAAALGIELPATALNRELYERLIAQGDGDLDHSALIRIYGAR